MKREKGQKEKKKTEKVRSKANVRSSTSTLLFFGLIKISGNSENWVLYKARYWCRWGTHVLHIWGI